MANIIVNPIIFNPGAVANGTSYTPAVPAVNNYITIPNVEVTADIIIPSETFDAIYTPIPEIGARTIDHAMAIIFSSSFVTSGDSGTLTLTFHSQVFFNDNTSDVQIIEASIDVIKPSDFSTFAIVGPFNPVIPLTGVVAAIVGTTIKFSITINEVTLAISGNASVKVQVAI